MQCQILKFPEKIKKASTLIVLNYENHLCHKIFLEERIEDLEVIRKSHDLLKHTSHKNRPLTGDMKFKTLAYLNNPCDENWELLKEEKIFNKKTALDVWNNYKHKMQQEVMLTRENLLLALEYAFEEDFEGYKSRLSVSLDKLKFIKDRYPSIDSQIDLSKIN